MRSVTLFYSWQSDRPTNLCHDFIRRALDLAAEELEQRRGIKLVIDSDTQGIPGTPPITATILQKIDACDIMLADMTFVSETDAGKLAPNPNVMGEYGYALNAKGTARILLAMNDAFGPANKLPFDLHHLRHPNSYSAPVGISDGARRDARKAFAARLASHIELIVDHIDANPGPAAADELQKAEVLLGNTMSGRFVVAPPISVSGPYAEICIVPLEATKRPKLDLKAVKAARGYMTPDFGCDALEGIDQNQWWSHGLTRRSADKPNPEAKWSTRLMRPGVMEWCFTLGEQIGDDPTILVEGRRLEAEIVNAVDVGCHFLREIGIGGTALIGVALYGTENVQISGGRTVSRPLRQPNLMLPSSAVAISTETAGNQMQDAFDALWLAAGSAEGSPSFGRGEWAGYWNERPYLR